MSKKVGLQIRNVLEGRSDKGRLKGRNGSTLQDLKMQLSTFCDSVILHMVRFTFLVVENIFGTFSTFKMNVVILFHFSPLKCDLALRFNCLVLVN